MVAYAVSGAHHRMWFPRQLAWKPWKLEVKLACQLKSFLGMVVSYFTSTFYYQFEQHISLCNLCNVRRSQTRVWCAIQEIKQLKAQVSFVQHTVSRDDIMTDP